MMLPWVWAIVVAGASPQGLDVDACVRLALSGGAQVAQARAKVVEYEARLRLIESVYWPKLNAMAFAAPTPTVKGNGYDRDYRMKYDQLSDWGPYFNLEMQVVQPLYTFGRAEAGATAAQEQAQVERARLQAVRSAVAMQVRRLYYAHLFARSILPTLQQAIKILEGARARAETLYEAGTGEVTQVELAKLDYGLSEARRFALMARDGAALAAVALKHTMGMKESVAIEVADRTMPPMPAADRGLALHAQIDAARVGRPEWAQLTHGRNAARAWALAEARANYPVLFLAGQLRYGWTDKRERDTNPWHFDNYNTLSGGLALGFKFDLDPMLATAKSSIAKAVGKQVEAMAQEAETGIDLQVRQAHDDVARARESVAISQAGFLATRQWMTSAATAYQSGMGEARDLLEGLAAYVQAKRALLESLQSFHTAAAELRLAMGEI
ncbi:MAG: TolC family protein [Deltaproteobacteria bacterium]|nr:MAG: TolC family protein [Deltaproteobacteria bacterium]